MIYRPLLFLFTTAFLVSCSADDVRDDSRVDHLPYYTDATFTPKWLNPDEVDHSQIHRVSSFNFIDQDGKEVTEDFMNDKISVVDFFFTSCPGICPKMTSNMSLIQNEFLKDNDVVLFSHSVTPNVDSVSVLKRYAIKNKVVSSKWHLLTGDRDEIYRMGRQVYFVEEDLGLKKDTDEFLHTENFILVDKNKHIRGIYNGLNKTSIQQLMSDIKLLQKEA